MPRLGCIWIINELFKNGPATTCQDAADANSDGRVDSADAVYLIDYLLRGGSQPPELFPLCGAGPECDDGDEVPCDQSQVGCP